METLRKKPAAFSVVECLVVLAIVAIVAVLVVFGVPQVDVGLTRDRVTQMLANARSLQQASAAMTFDNRNASASETGWTAVDSHGKPRPASLAEYFASLTNGSAYLSEADLRKLLALPGKKPPVGPLTADNIPFRIYWPDTDAPADQPIIVSQNFGEGFVYYAKGGGGGVKRSKENSADLPGLGNGHATELK